MQRRKIQTPFYEALEARNLLAADLLVDLENAISLSDLQKTASVGVRGQFATEPTSSSGLKGTHQYYVDGQAHGLVVLNDRIAVARSSTVLSSVQAAELAKYGLEVSRPLAGSNFTVYTATSPIDQALINLAIESGWASEVVPVFGSVEAKNEIALLNEVIVKLPNGGDAATFFADSKYTSYTRLAGTPDTFVATLSAGNGPSALNVINEVGNDPRVTWATPNFHQVWQKHFTPNDTNWTNLWGHNNTGQTAGGIGAPAGVPDADSNLPEAYDFTPVGGDSSIIVGTLDDGIDILHADLNVYVGDSGVTDTNANGWIGDNNGWDFVNNNNTIAHTDIGDGHGTATAGIASARGNNNLGITGVAYNTRSLAAQMFDGAAVATTANIASAIFYLGGRTFDGTGTWDSADIVSHSWGGGADTPAINDALTWTTNNGVPTFFSSGNGGGAIGYPASQATTNPGISVIGAYTNTAQASSYHAFGAALDFLAPSNNFDPDNFLAIDTTDRSGADGYGPTDYTGTGATGFGGTSASAPHAAGIAALVRARANSLSVPLTGANYRALMRNNTRLMDAAAVGGYSTTTGHNLLMGHGALDAFTLMDGIGQARISATTATAELVSASTTNLGTAFVSQSVDFRIRIRNQGTSVLNLTSLTAAGTDYTISEAPGDLALALGESTSFVVRVTPTAAGLRTGSVTIASNDSSLPSMLLNLEVTAVAPDAAGYVFEDRNGNGTREAGEGALANHFVYADANANGTFDTTAAPPAVGGPITILDNTENIGTQVVAGLGDFVSDVNVTLNVTHTWVADMAIILEAPTGQQVLLFNQRGGSGDNLVSTVFDDSATVAIGAGVAPAVAPFTGSFRPETPLSILAGQPGANLNGTWTLRVFDVATGDTGTVTDWTLNISTGEASDFSDSLGFYAFDGLANGSYSSRYGETGWTPSTVASHPFTISSPASSTTGMNFGVGRNNRFYAHVFNDLDADGIVDGGEGPRVGRKIFIDTNNNSIDDTPTTTNITAAPGTALPDNTTVDVPVTVAGITGNITDINLTINMTHTWMADVELTLIAPDGTTQAKFFDNHGGSGDNLTNTVFDDEAATLISAGTAPFTGSFRPFAAFTIFDGLTPAQANGTWTIRMNDNATGDTGVLVNYDLKIDHGSDEFDLVTGADGWVNFDLPAGAQNMRLVSAAGWNFTIPTNGLRTPTVAGAPLFNQTYGERTPPSTAGVGRNVFYKGGTIAGAPASLFPTNKVIAKQGPTAQTLTYANVINHTRGINGMVFDYDGLPGGALSNSDFVFQWSPQGGFDATLPANQPAAWATAPNPSAISNNLLSGTTRRIQLEWTDGSIVDRWIRVTVNANANTGLGSPEIFYLGHKAGEVNGQITNVGGTQPFGRFTVTNLGDVTPIRSALNQTGLTADSFTDLNKSGNVNNLGDVTPVRAAINSQLTVIQTPATPAPNFGGNGSVRGGRSNSDASGFIFGGLDRGNEAKSDSVDSSRGNSQIVDDVFAGFDSQLIGNSINVELGQDDFSSKKAKKVTGNVSNDLVDLSVKI